MENDIIPYENQLLTGTSSINIEFQDLCYTVRGASGHKSTKIVLKNVEGEFRAGELTALMGPSGAGKSSLMNILAGYVSSGVTGVIKINGSPRNIKQFNKLSSYIMQEDLLQQHLTVNEAMTIAAHLKLGDNFSDKEKIAAVNNVLTLLGLINTKNTRVERLSGGQRKRLSVALELVNNPPVIFLDEPTTGLDSVSIKQCVKLLQKLARQGRTILCTIHQPSSSVFQMFDQVYFLAKGQCVYNGSTKMLVPFMSSVGLSCPLTYNPADYMIEIVQGVDATETIKTLTSEINNGRNQKWHASLSVVKQCNVVNNNNNFNDVYKQTVVDSGSTFPTSFWTQFTVLLSRKFLQMSRNLSVLYIQCAHHLISGLLLGGIYFGVGNDAKYAISNFKFCISCIVFFMYTYIMIPILLFPTELKLVRREYFNRWYGLKAYYCAYTLSTIPAMVVFGILFMVVSYVLSSQPMDFHRFLLFTIFGILTGLCSEGLGLAVGSICSVTNGSIVGPASAAPLLALCVYGMGSGEILEPVMAFLMSLSYLRYGLVGLTESVYGFNRTNLACIDTIYCHYKMPDVLLRDVGMEHTNLITQIIGLSMFIFLFRMLAYLFLRYRLTSEFSNKILNYAAKILRHK